MTWWQSVLIALIPAALTAFISWLISYQQIRNTKKELQLQYDSENKLYITKTRFDMEFSIYKELCEKVLEMVMDTSSLFPRGLYNEPLDEAERKKYREEKYKKAANSFNEANTTIRKYAAFIPEQHYENFCEIRKLCAMQLNWYPDFRLGGLDSDSRKELNDKQQACWKRTEEINEKLDSLIKALREYLERLDVKNN